MPRKLHSTNASRPQQTEAEQRFDQCFREHYAALCQFAFTYLKDEEAAADLVQDCFLKLWEGTALTEKFDHIRPYLYALVRNKCIDSLRRKAVNEKRIDKYIYLSAQWQDEEIDELTKAETYRQLYAALEALPPHELEMVKQHYIHGLKYREIAEILQLNADNIRKKTVRVLKSLSQQIRTMIGMI